MHTNNTYNSLTIDNPDTLPFPPEMKTELVGYKWDDMTWNAVGLPAFQCTFCLTGDQLYFEKDPNDEVKLRKEDFTGQIIIDGVITPKECPVVFFIRFELTFCGGLLSKTELVDFKTEPRAAYDVGFKRFQDSLASRNKIRNSFWFRYLYRPYFYAITIPTMLFVRTIEFLLKGLVWIIGWLVPIKL